METAIQVLQKTKLLEGLQKETIINTLLPNGKIKTYNSGESVINLLERVNTIGVVLKGTLQVVQIFSDGNIRLIEKLLPSYIIGSELICTSTQKSPYSILSEKQSKVIYFQSSMFLNPGVMEESERSIVINNLLNHLSQYNMRKYYRIAILAQHSIRDRVLTYLSMQSRKLGKNSFTVSFTREEMASFLCVNRSALSNELSKMKQEGLIDFHENRFTLILADALSESIFLDNYSH